MGWGLATAVAIIILFLLYEIDKFRELLTDIRDSLANIESHFVGEDED